MKKFLLFGFCFLLFSKTFGQLTIASPDKKIVFNFRLTEKAPVYTVAYNHQNIINASTLSFDFKDSEPWGANLTIQNATIQQKDEYYTLVVGKAKRIRNHYREANIELLEKKNPRRRLNLFVRVYNDGVAFRYEFPRQKNLDSLKISSENSTFNFAQNPVVYTLFREHYCTSHEGLYTKIFLDSIRPDTLMDMPTLFELKNTFVAITEAALLNYAGMYLSKTEGRNLTSKLSPLPNQTDVKAVVKLPHTTPWRVIMIADKVGKLIESNILTNLNEDPDIQDWSWLIPKSSHAKTTFTWWNGDYLEDVDFKVGMNYETHKHYIDFCAANHIDFHSVVSFGNFAWYQGETEGFNPGSPNADVAKPVDSLDMERLAEYSRQKGVGLRVWVNWKSLSRKIEEAFAQYEKWNIKGLMVDFMDRDDQEMVRFVEEVLQKAAKYHLHIQFHGAYKPTGLSRKYPNELTKEGVLNLEVSKWNGDVEPEHNVMVAFTRMLAGPLDYHAGGFRSVTREAFIPGKMVAPNVLGTRCHHLAMPVVYESYLQMICDYPEAYKNQPGFEFLCQVPTSWDETKVLNAQIGDYITIARRKGKDWYVGTMNDWTPRVLTLKLDFLPKGTFWADIFSDADDSGTAPNHITRKTIAVSQTDTLTIKLAEGGGQAIWIRVR